MSAGRRFLRTLSGPLAALLLNGAAVAAEPVYVKATNTSPVADTRKSRILIFDTEGAFVFDSLLEREQKVRYWSAEATGGRWIRPLDPARCETEGDASLAWPSDLSTPDSGDVIHHQTAEAVAHFLGHVRRARS